MGDVDVSVYRELKEKLRVVKPMSSDELSAMIRECDRAVVAERWRGVKNEKARDIIVRAALLFGENSSSALRRSAKRIEHSRNADKRLLKEKEFLSRRADIEYGHAEREMRSLCNRLDDADYLLRGMDQELSEIGELIDSRRTHVQPNISLLPQQYLELDVPALERDREQMRRTINDLQHQTRQLHVEVTQQHYMLQQLDQIRQGYSVVISHIHEGMIKKARQNTPFLLPELVKVWKSNLDVMKVAESDDKVYAQHQRMSDTLLSFMGSADQPLQNPYAGRFTDEPDLSLQGIAVRADRQAFYESLAREASIIRQQYR